LQALSHPLMMMSHLSTPLLLLLMATLDESPTQALAVIGLTSF
jgi:hypothetical protein